MGHDFEPREIRSFDVEADLAPEIGRRVARYRAPELPPGEYVTEYDTGPWVVVDLIPVAARPDWVRVYAVLTEGWSAPWEDEEPEVG